MASMDEYKDPIYGQIYIPHLAQLFIATNEFQRLKKVNQCGNVPYALGIGGYNTGDHNRYEHCIGTMHLSGLMFDNILDNSKNVIKNIHEKYSHLKIYVMLAGLLHDIGHGPRSHLFQEAILKKNEYYKENRIDQHLEFNHEQHSIDVIEEINNREKIIKDSTLVHLINAMILGNRIDNPNYPNFIFEIVANKTSGLDTDKLDYLRRDAYYFHKYNQNKVYSKLDVDSIINNVVINKKKNITFPIQIKDIINSVFLRRKQLFTDIYYNPKVVKYDKAIICYLFKLINTQENIYFYASLNDETLDIILAQYGFDSYKQECIHKCSNCKDLKLKREAKLSGDTNLDPITLIKFT